MSYRLRPAKRRSLAALAVASVVAIPVYGWVAQVPFALAALALLIAQRQADRVRRPEYVLAGVWVCAQAAIVAAIALSEGPRIYVLPVLVFPMLVAAPVFPRRVVAVGAGLGAATMIATAFAFMPGAVEATPPVVVFPVLLLITLTMLAARTLAAEEDSRHAVVVDPLTGLLNRGALQARAAELTHHMAGELAAEAAVIVADIDRFKAINDELGHTRGDAVLVEVARRLARVVTQNGSLYRFGGEEFVVLLEGSAASTASELAERMRTAVQREPVADLPITMSFGVAHSDAGARDYARLFANADRALYRAKAAGRNCVRGHESGEGAELRSVSGSPAKRDAATDVKRDRRRHPATPARPGSEVSPSAAVENVPHNLIIRTAAEREHMLDLSSRTREIAKIVNPLTLAALVAAVPWLGWQSLVPVVISVAVLQLLQVTVVARSARPEYPRLVAVFLVVAGTGLGLVIANEAFLFALPLLTILMFSNAAAFPAPAAAGMAVITAAMMTGVAFLLGADQVLHNPSILVFPLALLAAVSFFGNAIGAVTVDQLAAATTDSLTGMLNRGALRARVAELAQGGAGRNESVAVLMADLDHFKAVNDEHGHDVGDRVLVEVADRVRACLRPFDAVYRIGGEEFVALLVGADEEATAIAERIRQAVRRTPIAGLSVSISIGVVVSGAGEPFDYDALYASVDDALLAAKAAGRDQVRRAPADAAKQPVAA